MSESNPLQIAGLGHAFGKTQVVEFLDLTVGPGEFVALLGPSGSGKTTVLRAIAGLLTPLRGTITIGGRLAVRRGREQLPAERRGVGLVFQDYALFPHLSVSANVAFGLARSDPKRVDQLLKAVGLSELGERRPAQLSGGQQQRVALARALAPKPALLLLDEPFANVDAELRAGMGAELSALATQEGTAVMLVTHDRSDALALADRVVILAPGELGSRKLQEDTPQAIYHRPVSALAAQLTGPVGVLSGMGLGLTAATELGEFSLVQPHLGPVTLLIRPERARFEPDPSGPVEVAWTRYAGRSTLLGLGALTCEWTQPNPPAIGTRGRVVLAGRAWAVPT
jgi:iron(III) transport system ATP-binding protein